MITNLQSPVVGPFFIGREEETEYLSRLLADFERFDTSFLLVEGAQGIGKTSLVRHVLQHYNGNKTFVLCGKCSDQPGQVPYQAWKEAIGDWMGQIMVLSEDELNRLRQNAAAALQHNMSAVTVVFEELELFFGKNFEIAPVKTESHQIKSKFYYFFGKFLKSVSRFGYRIILFLDDLQWADPASRALTEELVLRNAVPGLIMIGAQRPQENRKEAPEKVEPDKDYLKRVVNYQLKPLGSAHFNRFIPAHWGFTPDEATALGQYLWSASGGNPLKAKEIIKSIRKSRLAVDQPVQNAIRKDLTGAIRSGSPEHLVLSQLTALSPQQKKLLSAASCIGYHFKAVFLSQVTNLSLEKTNRILSSLVQDELLVRKGSTCVFTHDVIFSAVISVTTDEEKGGFHRKIGRIMLDDLASYDQDGFFMAVSHLNAGQASSENAAGFDGELILMNISAAWCAIKKSAFEKAWQYFSYAEGFLKHFHQEAVPLRDSKLTAIWGNHGTGKDDLHYLTLFGFAETSFLMQQFDRALFYAGQILKPGISRHEKILATLIKIRICSALIYKSDVQELLQDGMKSLESVLNDFGILFPADPDELMRQADASSREISRLAAEMSDETDFSEKIDPDREYQDLMTLVMNSMTFVYYMDVRKNLYLGTRFLLLNFTKGFTPMTPVLFALSFISASVSPAYERMALLLGRTSLRMIETLPFRPYSYIVYYIGTLNFFAWEHPYKTCVAELRKSVLQAKEAGDHHYASFCATNVLLLNTYRGQNLEKHLRYAAKLARQNQHIFFISAADTELSAYLAGSKAGFMESRFIFPEELVREAEKNLSARFHLNLALQKLYYLSGDPEKALEAGRVCERLENVYRGFQIKLEHYFFYSLILFQRVGQNPLLLSQALEEVGPKLEEFRRLQAYGSGNYRHKILLLEAEVARCQGEFETAVYLYDQAISEAKKEKFTHHAAIASELAGNCYLGKNIRRSGRTYLKEAFRLYKKWGAGAKLEWLEHKYPFLRKADRPDGLPVASVFHAASDLIHQAALLRETGLVETGSILLKQLSELSRARGGAILTEQAGQWKVLNVEGLGGDADWENKSLVSLENRLPVKAINYAINKGEKLLLPDVAKMSFLGEVSGSDRTDILSVLCYPVAYGLKTEALIYLENIASDLDKDEWFWLTTEHVAMVLANALHDEKLRRLNRELQVQEQKKIEAVIASQETEQKRIAEELHDSVGQMLSLVKLNLSRMEAVGKRNENEGRMLIPQISRQLDESIGELRTISHNLMPPDLHSRQLAEIIGNLLEKSRKMNGPKYVLRAFGVPDDLSAAVKFTLYRVLQEILQNIVKHAFSGTITVGLTGTDEGINLMVEDDGVGFDISQVKEGLGLKNIRSRVRLLNGYFDVDSAPRRGTIYNITIPLNH